MTKYFELIAESKSLPEFRKELRSLLVSAGWNEETLGQILVAIDEALTNVIRHAYQGNPGKIKIIFEDNPLQTEIIIEDHGTKFDPTKIPEPELPPQKPGGLGIHFIRTIMDAMIYDSDYQEGNRIHLIKKKAKISKREGVL